MSGWLLSSYVIVGRTYFFLVRVILAHIEDFIFE
jgi:hypothetical protein